MQNNIPNDVAKYSIALVALENTSNNERNEYLSLSKLLKRLINEQNLL